MLLGPSLWLVDSFLLSFLALATASAPPRHSPSSLGLGRSGTAPSVVSSVLCICSASSALAGIHSGCKVLDSPEPMGSLEICVRVVIALA